MYFKDWFFWSQTNCYVSKLLGLFQIYHYTLQQHFDQFLLLTNCSEHILQRSDKFFYALFVLFVLCYESWRQRNRYVYLSEETWQVFRHFISPKVDWKYKKKKTRTCYHALLALITINFFHSTNHSLPCCLSISNMYTPSCAKKVQSVLEEAKFGSRFRYQRVKVGNISCKFKVENEFGFIF